MPFPEPETALPPTNAAEDGERAPPPQKRARLKLLARFYEFSVTYTQV